MSSSTRSAATWAPDLDLSPTGLSRFDPARVQRAIDDGYRDGYAAGRAEAHEAGRREVAEHVEAIRDEAAAVLASVAATGERLARHEETTARAFAEAVAGAATRIAEAILARELTDETVAATAAVERALGALGRRTGIVLQLHPDDLALLDTEHLPDDLRLEPNPGLDRGDAVGHTADRTVDARLAAALDRARAALSGHDDPAAGEATP